MQDWKMRNRKIWDQNARVENAGLENAGKDSVWNTVHCSSAWVSTEPGDRRLWRGSRSDCTSGIRKRHHSIRVLVPLCPSTHETSEKDWFDRRVQEWWNNAGDIQMSAGIAAASGCRHRPGFPRRQELVQDDSPSKTLITQLCRYVQRQWISKSTIGVTRMSVGGNPARANNAVESFHAALRRRVKVAHPNLYSFLGHLQRTTTDCENDIARLKLVSK